MRQEYGYCRISTPKQNIDRQERNILEIYPAAHIIKEVYTGTKTIGRKEWNKLYKLVKQAQPPKASVEPARAESHRKRRRGKRSQLFLTLFRECPEMRKRDSNFMKNCFILELALYFLRSSILIQTLTKKLWKAMYK